MEVHYLFATQVFYHPTFDDALLSTERFKKLWVETAIERKQLSDFILDVIDYTNPSNKLYHSGKKPEDLADWCEEKTDKLRTKFNAAIGEIFMADSQEENNDFNIIESKFNMMKVMANLGCVTYEKLMPEFNGEVVSEFK